MKILVLLFLVAASQAAPNGKPCDSDDDCDVSECCIEKSAFFRGKCQSLPHEGEYCIPKEAMDMIGDKGYKPGCPCATGFECVPEEVINEESGTIIFKNTKCNVTSLREDSQ